jgi:hypothetical protein
MAEQTISREEMNKKLKEEPVEGDSQATIDAKNAAKAAEKADKYRAQVYAPASRELNRLLNTPDAVTQGLVKPEMNRPDIQGAYQAATPQTTPTLAAEAAKGTFDATAGQAAVPTPESTKQWTSQMVAPDTAGMWQGVNAPQAVSDTTVKQGQAAGMAPDLLNQLMAASRGQGPSASQAQLQAGMDQAIAASAAQTASARGAMNPAILRQQQQQLATATQQAAGQSAATAAQEQQQAMKLASDAVAANRQIESSEQQLTTQIKANLASGNRDAALELVKQKQEQTFAGIAQQAKDINQAVLNGEMNAAAAEVANAQLQTQVELQNADLAFKASQGDQAAQLQIDELNVQNINNMMNLGLSYDQAQLQADQYWNSLVVAGRELQANTALGIYQAKMSVDAAKAGRAEGGGGGGFFSSLMTTALGVGANVLSKKLSGTSSSSSGNAPAKAPSGGTVTDSGGGSTVTGGGEGASINGKPMKYNGGVITPTGYACGGTVHPRINMAAGGTVPPPAPQAVASGGLSVHPSMMQAQPQPIQGVPASGAPVPGDHPANDVVSAQLSPGEIVVPRSAVASGRSGILSFIDALDKEGKLGEARGIASTPSYGEVLQAKQKLKNV